MPERIPGTMTERLLSRRVRPLVLLCALFVVIALGIMLINHVRQSTQDVQENVTDLRIERDQALREQQSTENELASVDTDDYVIARAREIGYMMPNETLFVITNTDALYGETPAPTPKETP